MRRFSLIFAAFTAKKVVNCNPATELFCAALSPATVLPFHCAGCCAAPAASARAAGELAALLPLQWVIKCGRSSRRSQQQQQRSVAGIAAPALPLTQSHVSVSHRAQRGFNIFQRFSCAAKMVFLTAAVLRICCGRAGERQHQAVYNRGQQLLAASDAAASCSSEQLNATFLVVSGVLLIASKW